MNYTHYNILVNTMDINQYWESYQENMKENKDNEKRGVQYEI
jgi:hypothetical protein